MRIIPAALQEKLDSGVTTLCRCWVLTRRDGVKQGFTDHDEDILLDAVTCRAGRGLSGSEATAQGDQNWRGVKRLLTTPSYASAHYTKDYDPELAAKALEPFRNATIGYVGTYQMSYALLDYVKRTFPKARYVDASDMVDRIKVIKSAEEMELVKRAALMQDGAMRAAFAAVKPGMRDTEVAAAAQHYSVSHGSENGIYLCASMPLGTPSKFGNKHLQNRVIQKGDQIALLVEDNGPGGMYTELGRSCVVGAKVPQAMKDELDFVKESRKLTLDLLKPGASCKDIWDGFNAFMRKNGRPMEARLYCHGQGYDLVERPLLRSDETMPLAANMNMAVHPGFFTKTNFVFICDNFLIKGDGAVEHLHKSEQKIWEL